MQLWTRALALFVIFSFSICAQVGRITGKVVDASGAAVPGAMVGIQLAGTGVNAYTGSTNEQGDYSVLSVRSETYDVVVEKAGFLKNVTTGLKVDAARETEAPRVRLDVASITESVEVTAATQTVNVNNAEISTTITQAQIQNLPNIGRSPLAFLGTQAGVNTSARGATTINGQRASFSNVTFAGVNIQDNFIRSNDLDFLPNLLLLDQVQEVTLSTSNTNPSLGGGSAQVVFVPPSGTNTFHGKLYWANRNNALAANSWFNNRDGINLPFLNQNQVGGSLGGPIIKNKLFFYTNYEAFRLRQQSAQNRTILTADARQGIFTYKDSGGVIRKVNVLQAAGVQADPAMQTRLGQVPDGSKINNFRNGDSSEGFLRNTGGYSFVERNNRTRDNVTGNFDYLLSTKHSFSATYLWNRDILDRPDLENDYSIVPKVSNNEIVKLFSVAWRSNFTPRLTNEARFGFNWAPAIFDTTESFPKQIVTGMLYSNPLNTFRFQGRNTDTYNMADNANYVRGKHTLSFGYQGQLIRVETYNEGGITPTYTIGIGNGNTGLTQTQLPGISASDLSGAQNLLATLAGYVSDAGQTFNVTSRSSGFVNGAINLRHLMLDNHAFYGQDSWKALQRLTITLGLRWDYYAPVTERDSLALLPVIENNNPISTLLNPNAKLDFAGTSSGRPWYRSDKNNFAPNIGFAYDVFGNGKTSFRAGYSVNFVNDETIGALDNSTITNAGLAANSTLTGISGRVSSGGLKDLPTPVFQVPRSFADNYMLSTSSAFGLPDPNLRTPYVQQWNAGIQQSIKSTVIEIRYVGNHATKQFRAFDYNQVVINENGFLPDFLKAQQNGYLALAATGMFNPAYNANIAGSQQLPVFNRLSSGGNLGNASVRSFIQTGQVGSLGEFYQTNKVNGAVNFFRNPNALGTNFLTNYSNATYNGLQVDVTRRFANGFQAQTNYVYSRTFSDTAGVRETRFEPFLDINNAKIERSRVAAFDLTHIFKANAYYSLPLGAGHRVSGNGFVNRVIGGWAIGGIFTLQSGTPFSVLSQRGTLNRGGRSASNTATTLLNKGQLDEIFQFRMSGIGPYFVTSSVIGPDGRAVAPDGAAPFAGQAFFQPTAGRLGALQRNYFSGPSVWNLNFTAQKVTQITERQSVELRFEADNIFNHATFFVGDQVLTSTNFGRITSTFFAPRRVQLSLHYRF